MHGTQTPWIWWAIVGAVMLSVASVLELWTAGSSSSAPAMYWAASIGAGAGMFHGLLWAGMFSLLAKAKWPIVRPLAWLIIGIICALWLAQELGAVDRLDGPYRNLAIAGLLGSLVAGSALGVGAMLAQPTQKYPGGWLGGRPPAFRAGCALLLIFGVAATMGLDRLIKVGEYPLAHMALQVAGLWAAMFAVMLAAPQRPPPRRRAILFFSTVVAAFAGTAATLGPAQETSLHAILARPYSSLALRTMRYLGDPDLDGYSAILGGTDCAPFDAEINPGAQEIPGNHIDENCRLGDATDALAPSADVVWPDEESPTSVVLITVDTLSAPHMGLYGARLATTPELEKWATGAAVFDRAYTSGGWTSLAIPSLFRGVTPRRMQWTKLIETTEMRLLRAPFEQDLPPGESVRYVYGLPLDEPRVPIAQWLSNRGMATMAVVNDGSSEFLDPEFMGAGFDQYLDLDIQLTAKHRRNSDRDVTDNALSLLDSAASSREPFFMWVHYFGPHLGNTIHPEVKQFGKSQQERYAHEILYMDQEVSRLLARLDTLAETRNLLVVFTSDHGEAFHKTGRGHGGDVREQSIRIPIIVKGNGFHPGRYRSVASIVDIYPTILTATESPFPPGLDGIALQTIAKRDAIRRKRVLIAETWRFGKSGAQSHDYVAAFDGHLKLTWNLKTEAKSLRIQGLKEDRKQNLLNAPSFDAHHLNAALEAYLEQTDPPRLVN